MIKREEVKAILLNTTPTDIELLQVVRRYIYDLKGYDVGEISRCKSVMHGQLMIIAVESASKFYANEISN